MVITDQPKSSSPTSYLTSPKREYSNRLIKDCCASKKHCLCYCFNPFYLACEAERMNEHCCTGWLGLGGLMAMRAKLRTAHDIDGGICGDCIMGNCCLAPCMACQMSNEMDNLGYSKGRC